MNKANGILFGALVITLSTISLARANDDDSDSDSDDHPPASAIFVNVSVANPGVGEHGVAEFKLIHIPDEEGSALFEDGKTYFAYKKANDNMLALATWSVTHEQLLVVKLDPSATGKKAIIFQMFLGGPLEPLP